MKNYSTEKYAMDMFNECVKADFNPDIVKIALDDCYNTAYLKGCFQVGGFAALVAAGFYIQNRIWDRWTSRMKA